MTFLYFAYGSNMLPARLRARCPSAHVIGAATAAGYDVEFSKRSVDGSGKATLVEAAGTATPGVLFEIGKTDLIALDRAEGASGKVPGYERIEDFSVSVADEPITATTYIASRTERELKPFDWYLALVIAGVRHHALGDEHMQRLRLIEHLIDDVHGRKSRAEALEALLFHGFADHHVLLKKAG